MEMVALPRSSVRMAVWSLYSTVPVWRGSRVNMLVWGSGRREEEES